MKRHILHVKKIYLPLTETFIYRQLIARKAFPVRVIAEEHANLEIFPLDSITIFNNGPLTRYLDYLGYHLSGRKFFWESFLAKQIAKAPPALIHAHFGDAGGVCNYRLAQRKGIPFVVSFYGYDASTMLRKARWRRRYLRLFASCTRVIAVSQDMKQRLMAHGCPEHKLRIVHVGIPLKDIVYQEKQPPISNSDYNLLMVGRMVEKKGLFLGIQALALLKRTGLQMRMRIIGDGPLMGKLKKLAQELEVPGQIMFMGKVPFANVYKELHRAHLLLVPSVTAANGDMEGLPAVILDAMAAGTPVIASRHSGIPEAVKHGGTGFLFPEGDYRALAEQIQDILATPDNWPQITRSARQLIEQDFNIDTEVAKIEAIYQEILG